VYVCANLLARFGRAKDPNNRHLRASRNLRRSHIVAQLWVIAAGCRLVMIDAVQSDSEQVHTFQHATPSGTFGTARMLHFVSETEREEPMQAKGASRPAAG